MMIGAVAVVWATAFRANSPAAKIVRARPRKSVGELGEKGRRACIKAAAHPVDQHGARRLATHAASAAEAVARRPFSSVGRTPTPETWPGKIAQTNSRASLWNQLSPLPQLLHGPVSPMPLRLVGCFLVFILGTLHAAVGDAAPRMDATTETNVMTEITFTAAANYADPFHDVTLDARFT